MDIKNLKYTEEVRPKKGFGASDAEKLSFDIYHAFKGTPKTNPTMWWDTLKFGAGKGVELAMVDILKENGIVAQDFDQSTDETFEMEREGVKVRMKIDAIVDTATLYDLEKGAPIEIKSVNNKNSVNIKEYEDGKPRSNYVLQLAVYMDYLGKDTGYLFVSSIDGLHYFWFTCHKLEGGKYQCGNTIVDLAAEYKRWAKIWNENVVPSVEPKVEVRYKVPVQDIKIADYSTTDISKARNGAKVLGDKDSWVITYSPYKALILAQQGVQEGYTDEELGIIKTVTAGYSAKK